MQPFDSMKIGILTARILRQISPPPPPPKKIMNENEMDLANSVRPWVKYEIRELVSSIIRCDNDEFL